MNKAILFLLASLVGTCAENSEKSALNMDVIHNSILPSLDHSGLDTLWISPQSKIRWKGTKMRGLGKHEGALDLENGYLIYQKSIPARGYFVANMQSIEVTDIPKSDPIPLKNLTDHLKNEDFFAVDNFPNAFFQLNSFIPTGSSTWEIHGDLTLKGITNPIKIEAEQRGENWRTHFILDRLKWNVAYTGSWADRTLVDREIEIWVELFFDNRLPRSPNP